MDLKVSDFAHDPSTGVFTVVVGGRRLTSKNPFSLFSSALQLYAPEDRPKMAQSLSPVVEQWNLCLSPALIDAANHSTTKELSDNFYNTLTVVCPTELEKYETKYVRDQTKQYTKREVVTLLTKLECKDKVLLGKFGMQKEVDPETGALDEKGVEKILSMTKKRRNEVKEEFSSARIRSPCDNSKSCMKILNDVLQVQTKSVLKACEKAEKRDKMQMITTIITIVTIVLVIIAVGVVIGVFHSRSKKAVVVEEVVPETGTAATVSEPVTEIELPPDTELKLSPLKLE